MTPFLRMYRYVALCLFIGWAGCRPPGSAPTDSTQKPAEPGLQLPIEVVEETAIEFQELSRPNKVRAWVDNLIVKAHPGKDMPQVAVMREGETARYLYQRTIRKSAFKLRDQVYNEPWLLVETKEGIIGWVHGGGVLFVEPKIEIKLPQQTDPTARSLPPESQTALPPEKEDYLIQPGKRVGPVKSGISEEKLVLLYGPEATRAEVKTTGDQREPCTTLMSGSYDELRVTWKDEARTQVKAIYISHPEGKWHTQEGIHVGMSLADLTKLNRAPVSFYGFNWEYSGVISSYRSGALEKSSKHWYIVLGPADPSKAKPILPRFQGNKVFSSNAEGVVNLGLVIQRIVVYPD